MMRSSFLTLLLVVFVSVSFAQNKKSKKEAASLLLFSVNKRAVSADEFIYLYKKNHPDKTKDYTPEKIQEYLDLFINFKFKVEEARARGLDTTKAFKKEFTQYKEELRKPYLPDASLTDSLVKLTYNRLKHEVKASHILIKVSNDASPQDTLQAYNKIVRIHKEILGGKNFGDAAVEYSEDLPSAKMNKGALGYFTALQMVYPFENAAYNTPVGQVSAPVRTRFGYHLIYVEDKREARGEVEVSHIMIRTGEDRDNEKAKNTIFNIYDQLQAGVSWDELCKQYTEDPGSKESAGRLRPFGVGVMASVPAFEQTAFELQKPGEISDPFQTQYGWHIMRLEKKIPLAPFEEMSASLKNRVTRDERAQLSKLAMQAKHRKEWNFQEVQAVKTKAFTAADSTLKKGSWKMPAWAATEKTTLLSVQGKSYRAYDFFTYVIQQQKPTALAPEKYFEQLYNNFVDGIILGLQEEKILREHPEYGYLVNEYYEGILLFDIMEKEVWNKASADSTGQHAYFNQHQSSYQAKEDRVKATFYSSGTPDFRETMRPLILQGNEQKIKESLNGGKIKTESGYYKKGDKAVFSKINWSVGVHEAENNGMYYLAWLKELLPPGNMTFEEARPAVISDYQTFVEKQWVEQLKKKFTLKINAKGKAYVEDKLKSQ